MRYAAIDIGTVTCRLLVADVIDGEVRDLCRRSEIVNLGAGVDAEGTLSADAIDRVCAKVEEYLALVGTYAGDGPVQVRCMATSASRDARNADEFAARLAALGVDMSVIPGEREAGLSFLGASMGYDGERLLVADIGGGSTELVAGVGGQGVVHAHSFDIGCRRATERLLHSDPPTEEETRALEEWVHGEFAGFFDELAGKDFAPERFVAVAGTATSVVSISQEIDPYDPKRVHGQKVDAATVDQVYRRLASMPVDQRSQVVGLQPKRAPLIVAGLIILRQALVLSQLPAYYASETDILEGIVLDAASAH